MFKRICAVFIIVISLITCNAASFAATENTTTAMRMKPLIDRINGLTAKEIQAGLSKYSDVKTHWAKNYIGKLTLLGVIGGGSKKTFNPDGEMSVAGFIKMVTLSLGYKIPQSTKIGTQWYDTYIAQAKKDKLIDNGDFKNYEKAITREQASKILYRAAMMFQAAPKNQGELNVMKFRIKDYAKIGDRYKDCFVKAYYMGYFSLGSTAVCNPQGTLTRAQACTIVYRLLDAKERPVFKVKEGEYYISSIDGSKQYPTGSLENVQAINYMDKVNKKYPFYVDRIAGAPVGASFSYFDDKNEFETNFVFGCRFTIDINDTGAPVNNNWVCEVYINDSKTTKDKYLDIFTDLTLLYFNGKSDEAMGYITKALTANGAEYYREYKINDRYLAVHYVDERGMSLAITCKGGLTRAEFIKKYPTN